jgi:riboflavin kinase/FMN adenylyltransferase
MRIFRTLADLTSFKNPVITIGTFDGVHQGHQQLIERIKSIAKQVEGESVLITFEPHPRIVLQGEKTNLTLLTTIDEKIEALTALGVDNLVIAPFTKEFAMLSAKQYVEQFLIGTFHPHTIVIGYDHQFGHGREGNYKLLELYQFNHQFHLEEIPVKTIEEIAISSTRIRNAISIGKIDEANQLLNRPYSLKGTVIHGQKRGRLIGYPTANIHVDSMYKLIPQNGVYAVRVKIDKNNFGGMLNIGTNPTFESGTIKHIEVHVFDFDKDIYNQEISIEFISRLRDELKFDSVDALIKELDNDKIRSLEVLNQLI